MAKKKKNQAATVVVPVEDEPEEIQNEAESEEDSDEESTENGKESKGQMVQRHKREVKELKKKTQAMMHSFAKNDKKAKKETTEAVKKLEDELKLKHEKELKDLEEATKASEVPSSKEGKEETTVSQLGEDLEDASISQQKDSKQKRRRAAKLAEEQDRERRIMEEKKNTVSKRSIEDQQLRAKLVPKKLDVHQIVPDGNCLYSAIAHQMQFNGNKNVGKDYYQVLRKLAADYMRSNPDEFMPFIDSEDGDIISEEKFQQYCDTTANTTAWGGQLELKALVHALKCPIIVFTAESNSPNIEMGQEYNREGQLPIQISFHRHAYSLGEHYNSIVPAVESDDDS